MSILDLKKIDFISYDSRNDEVVLTISDHLDWDDTEKHLELLQEKVNSYLDFLESGGINDKYYSKYPDHINKNIVFQVIAKYKVPEIALRFYEKINVFLRSKFSVEIKLDFDQT